jgi:hypothetical protein
MMVLGLLFAAWHWRSDISQHVSAWYWQKQCAKFSLPPEEIMLESDAVDAAKLAATRPREFSTFLHVHMPGGGVERSIPAAERLLGVVGAGSCASKWRIVFVHERIAAVSGSKPRVLIVEIDDCSFIDTLGLRVRVLSMGTLFRLPKDVSPGTSASLGLHFENQPEPKLRVYAGQADPADASHFTIDYEQWDQRDTFDCWLQADDTVRIKPRQRPVPPPVMVR